MTDPLSLLREYNINKRKIIEKGGQIIFGEHSWPKNVDTNYVTWRCRKDGTPKKYYTLECLLFFVKHLSLTHPVYVRRAAEANISRIWRPDREDLVAYLTGKKTTCPAIDERNLEVKRSADCDESESPVSLSKKQRTEIGNRDVERVKEEPIFDSEGASFPENLNKELKINKNSDVEKVEELITVEEEHTTVKEEHTTVKEEHTTVKDEHNTVKEQTK